MRKHNRRKRKGSQFEMFAPYSPSGKLKEFGGSRLKSNPKRARPIATNKPVHLILKSEIATGSKYSLLIPKNARAAKDIIYSLAKRFKVKVDRYENVGNHLHIVAQFPSQEMYVAFIRGVSSSIARFVLGVSKALIKGIKFWQARPYTRIISWGKDLRATYKYLNYNRIQAIGFDLFVKEQIKLSD